MFTDALHPVALFANGIGDSITTLPALRALCAIFPGRLTIVCDRWAREVLFWDLPITEFIELESRFSDGTREFNSVAVASRLRSKDLLLSLVPWHSRSLRDLLQNLNFGETVGFHPDFHYSIPLDGMKHAADLAFDLLKFLDPVRRLEEFAYPPRYPPAFEAQADRIVATIPAGAKVLAVHCETLPQKRWRLERFAQTIDTFLDSHPEYLVFNISTKPQELPGLRHQHRVIPFCGHRLERALSLVSRADLFLGVDSSLLHAADFARVPGVGVFGPTNPLEFGFRVGPHRHVSASGALRDLCANRVLQALEELTSATAVPT